MCSSWRDDHYTWAFTLRSLKSHWKHSGWCRFSQVYCELEIEARILVGKSQNWWVFLFCMLVEAWFCLSKMHPVKVCQIIVSLQFYEYHFCIFVESPKNAILSSSRPDSFSLAPQVTSWGTRCSVEVTLSGFEFFPSITEVNVLFYENLRRA